MKTRPATIKDMDVIMDLVVKARGIMRSSGNMQQWTDGYPSRELIEEDIRLGRGFVEVPDEGGEPLAYFAYIEGIEPTYNTIYQGAWIDDDSPYAVIHRLASAPETHGVFDAVMAFATSRCSNLKVDTHRDNHIMQHNFLKHGFRYCGIIYLESGAERLAYQLITS